MSEVNKEGDAKGYGILKKALATAAVGLGISAVAAGFVVNSAEGAEVTPDAEPVEQVVPARSVEL